jgi:hypothetical protein
MNDYHYAAAATTGKLGASSSIFGGSSYILAGIAISALNLDLNSSLTRAESRRPTLRGLGASALSAAFSGSAPWSVFGSEMEFSKGMGASSFGGCSSILVGTGPSDPGFNRAPTWAESRNPNPMALEACAAPSSFGGCSSILVEEATSAFA